MDAAIADAGSLPDAAQSDAAQSDAGQPTYAMDAATAIRDAAAAEAGMLSDSGAPQDAGHSLDAAVSQDAGAPRDAGAQAATDSGSTDAAVSGVECAVMIGSNYYDGAKHYHGYLYLTNIGTTTWTLPTISFDIPVGFICNSEWDLPGPGWTLQTTANHCEYTKTISAPIAPNATLKFEWSSNYMPSIADPAAQNVHVGNCTP